MEFTPCKAEQPLRGMELQEKKTTKITGYRKYVEKEPTVPEFSCARKKTVDIDILVTSRNGD